MCNISTLIKIIILGTIYNLNINIVIFSKTVKIKIFRQNKSETLYEFSLREQVFWSLTKKKIADTFGNAYNLL